MEATSSKGSPVDVSKCCEAPLTSGGITVRRLTPEDIPTAAKICHEAFNTWTASVGLPPEYPPPEIANVPEELLKQGLQDGFEGFVAVDEKGTILGSSLVEVRDHIAGIGPLSVSTDAASKGIGKMLMQAAMQAAQNNGKEIVRLHQISSNRKSFSLYLACGFDPLVTCNHYEGVCTASAPEGFSFHGLAEKYVDACDELHERVYGYPRHNDITAKAKRQKVSHPAPGGVVLDAGGNVVAYSTGCFLSGHSVAATFEAFQVLTVGMSKIIEEARSGGAPLPPCTFHVPHTYPEVLRWLARNGFMLLRQVVQMGYGPHVAPKNGYYMPAIQY